MSEQDLEMEDALPEHPGKLMKEWLMDRSGTTASDLASKTGLSTKLIEGIVDGSEDVDPEIALKLSAVFGSTAETLYRMQAEFDHFKKHSELLPYEELPELKLPEPALAGI